ncbi:hypothetical protein EZI54_08575 [Marinobacter halodurans]|uniref:Uncharacterized protein n=1 Tax=Marinobacter halodurans TaxID=2528979 RepID=A0ABY1ZQQ9_9GAMM|nr:hypothetical protein [Marinobacter halodurans]TBW56692.1 hypothetical protein EZI54_08575 [Marinobacter halodurans]
MNDLEIYVREQDPARLQSWLDQSLDRLELAPIGHAGVHKGKGYYRDFPVRVSLYPGAFSKHFTSVVLEGDELPWRTDLDCARHAWRFLDVEVRCSPGDWQEGDPVQDEKWWRLDHRGEQKVSWN